MDSTSGKSNTLLPAPDPSSTPKPWIPNPNPVTMDSNNLIPSSFSKLDPKAPFFRPSHKDVEGNALLPQTATFCDDGDGDGDGDHDQLKLIEAGDLDEDQYVFNQYEDVEDLEEDHVFYQDEEVEFVHHEARLLQRDWNYGSFLPEWDNVDDFSLEWWELIQNNLPFRRYWLSMYQGDVSEILGGDGYFLESEFIKESDAADSEIIIAMHAALDEGIVSPTEESVSMEPPPEEPQKLEADC